MSTQSPIIAIALLLSAAVLNAQQTGVTGRVTDTSGAVVAGAIVSATELDGTKRSTLTNKEGVYQFPILRAASYVLRFEAAGFAPAERSVMLLEDKFQH